MFNKKIACVSIDLDPIDCYFEIHGLTPPESVAAIHYTRGLVRFLDLLDELSIKSTIFAIGKDLRERACGSALREAAERGHEPANHTWSHPYDLTRLPGPHIRQEIRKAHEAIEEASGRPPVGFRAPGYHTSDEVGRLLESEGYAYEASLLPSPPYYLSKSAVIVLSSLRGRPSRSIIGGAGMIFAPSRPYRSGRRYWTTGTGLLEIPCTVVTPLRIPFIGTTITLFRPRLLSAVMRTLESVDFISLEFHAIDMMDAVEDGFDALTPYQPDAKIRLEDKEKRIRGALSRIVGELGFEPMTLERAAGLAPQRFAI